VYRSPSSPDCLLCGSISIPSISISSLFEDDCISRSKVTDFRERLGSFHKLCGRTGESALAADRHDAKLNGLETAITVVMSV
jgi:hypothetical protein